MNVRTSSFVAGLGAGLGTGLALRGIATALAPGAVRSMIREYDKFSEGSIRALGVSFAIVGGLLVAQGIATSRAIAPEAEAPGAR